jgi:hypothetical protein
MRGNRGLYLIIAIMAAVIVVGGVLYYQERNRSGIDVEVGNGGISVETH